MFMQPLPPQPPSYQSVYSPQLPNKRLHSTRSKQSLTTQSCSAASRNNSQSTWSIRTRASLPSLRAITTRSTARSSLRTAESAVDNPPRRKWYKRVFSRSPTIEDGDEDEGDAEADARARTRERQDVSRGFSVGFENRVPYSEVVTFVGRCFQGVNAGW